MIKLTKALSEVYRGLKPGGKMYFIERVFPHYKHYKNLVYNLNSAWKKVGKCNIDRDTLRNIENAKFRVENYERFGNNYFVFIKGVGVKG